MSASRAFDRRVEALEDIFRFTAEAFPREGIDDALRTSVDFVLEELFTNIVKYGGPGTRPVTLGLRAIEGGVEVTLVDDEACPFDPRGAPDVDTTLAIGARTPGGLGLHLVRRLVDSLDYRYSEDERRATITFTKKGGTDARD